MNCCPMSFFSRSPSLVKQGKEKERQMESLSLRISVCSLIKSDPQDIAKSIERKLGAIADYREEWQIPVVFLFRCEP